MEPVPYDGNGISHLHPKEFQGIFREKLEVKLGEPLEERAAMASLTWAVEFVVVITCVR